MQAPEQIEAKGLADYLEVMSKAVFQSGMSWKVVESKWPGLREAFREFDPETLVALTEPELDELSVDGLSQVGTRTPDSQEVISPAALVLAVCWNRGESHGEALEESKPPLSTGVDPASAQARPLERGAAAIWEG